MTKLWSILFGVAMAAAFALFPISYVVGWWLPRDISTFGDRVDWLFYLILFITGFFFVLTEAILVWFMYRFDGRESLKPVQHTGHMSHETERKLELAWSIVPGLILIFIAVAQINAWADIKYQSNMPKPDGSVQQMEVTAKQWEWRVRYPNPERIKKWQDKSEDASKFFLNPQPDDVRLANEIHIWKGSKDTPKRVLVHLNTRDVIHSFFLPHVRVKQDALPGKNIPVWFAVTDHNCVHTVFDPSDRKWKLASELDPIKLKELEDAAYHRWEDGYNPESKERGDKSRIWELACAEFCGSRHSMMRGKLYVHESEQDYLAWLQHAAKESKRTNLPAAR